MRRLLALFLVAALVLVSFSKPAEADYILARFDLSLIYQNAPTMPPLSPPQQPNPQPNPQMPNPKQPYVKGAKGQPIPQPQPQPGGPNVARKVTPPVPPGTGPFIYSVIEVKKMVNERETDAKEEIGLAILFDHPLGKSARYLQMAGWDPNVNHYSLIKMLTPAKQFEKEIKPEAASKDETKFLDAAAWALRHGLKDEFNATMTALAKFAPKRPEVIRWQIVQKALAEPMRTDDPYFAALANDLGGQKGFRRDSKGHYAVLTDLPIATFDAGIYDRLRVLETTMENYYYWFALRPNLPQPELPKHRLGLVILKTPDDFYARHSEWGSQPFGGDAFTPRRDNFIVSSWVHLDEVFRKYQGNNDQARNEMVRAGLNVSKRDYVSGKVWEGEENHKFDPFRRAYCQTLTLTEKLIDDDQVRATHTSEGSRQLLFATGILPRHVHTPEWIAQGMSAFFETSTGAPYLEFGAPNWRHVVNLKLFREQGKFEKPGDVLRAVVTDRYFRATHRTFAELNETNDKAKINARIRDEYDLARSTAWALVYHQIDRRRTPEKLIAYCKELDSLPRDLDLDERALEACFAKAFDLGESRNPLRLDSAKLNTFAEDVFRDMAGVSLEIPKLQNEYFENRRSGKATNSMN